MEKELETSQRKRLLIEMVPMTLMLKSAGCGMHFVPKEVVKTEIAVSGDTRDFLKFYL